MQKLTNNNIKDIYKLSPMQECMYYQYLLDKTSNAYFEQIKFEFNGTLDFKVLKMSMDEILKKYDVLRTVFNHKKLDIPVQVVLKESDSELYYEKLENRNREEIAQYIEEYSNRDKKRLFDLNKDLLIRVAVFRKCENEFTFIWSFHHIIMDGWCSGIIISDFFQIYNSIITNTDHCLTRVTQYRKYIDWLQEQDVSASEKYWKEYIQSFDQMTSIPKLSTNRDDDFRKENVTLDISKKTTEALLELASKYEVTLNTVIQTIWGLILSKYNATNDVMFGTVVSGRPPEIEDIEQMIGLFINTIPARITYNPNETFIDTMKRVQHESVNSKKHHYYPLYKIQSESQLKQNMIDHIIVFENYPNLERVQCNSNNNKKIGRSQISNVVIDEQTSYDLTILINLNESINISFQYNANVFEKRIIETVQLQFLDIINQIIQDNSLRISKLEFCSENERNKILNEFNNTYCEYPSDKKIYDFLYEQAAKSPKAVAIICEDCEVTYQQFNEKSNQLARLLREKGICRDSIVGIMVERSLDMMIGIMAILKAGGAYLPISPAYPDERIEYILNDSGTELFLVQDDIKDRIMFHGTTINVVDEKISQYGIENVDSINTPHDLAYIIYTSGSTGKPKGVMIEHSSVINRIHWMQKKYKLTQDDIILQKTPYTFDVSVWELFWWMMVGAKMCLLIPYGEKNPTQIIEAIEKNKITVLHFVPSMLNIFLEYIKLYHEEKRIASLTRVFTSGETLTTDHVRKFNQVINQEKEVGLYNLYGPTEATVDVTYYDCPANEPLDIVPIGKPIDNTRIYILGKERELQPEGVPGEIYISGVGVARGYLNKPELTNEKFMSDIFVSGERMYKTGDLGRWSVDGNVEYLGRIDNQVKVRGFRIELEEVEEALTNHNEIIDALVCAKKEQNGINSLEAYIVTNKVTLSTTELRDYLKSKLPEYMIPSYFIAIDKIPLTSNGKKNRNLIREEGNQLRPDTTYIAPKTYNETGVAEIWKEVLKVDHVGLNDNFFELGGTSLDVITVISKINKQFIKNVEIVEMFTYPTISLFCDFLFRREQLEQNHGSEESINIARQDKIKVKGNIAKMKSRNKKLD